MIPIAGLDDFEWVLDDEDVGALLDQRVEHV